MRALALAEVAIVIYLSFLGVSLFTTLLADGMMSLVFELADGKGLKLMIGLMLVLAADLWRDSKREKLIIKGRLKPGKLF
ncbi:hypothetical protein [Bacillus infantis]|uniref:hypothetical protein n=1 Tax=Bacillus infantis TaxID=324767 RepID=UPI0021555DA2|nr:hypothetical protein [Bacillus infantis]MCR6612805.1 hypothetical protein [Bacillus infantis]